MPQGEEGDRALALALGRQEEQGREREQEWEQYKGQLGVSEELSDAQLAARLQKIKQLQWRQDRVKLRVSKAPPIQSVQEQEGGKTRIAVSCSSSEWFQIIHQVKTKLLPVDSCHPKDLFQRRLQ